MTTFSYYPDYGASANREPKAKVVQFGDGYSQRQADGINTNPETWNLQFSNRSTTEGNAIDTFLTDLGGVTSFTWTPPGGSSGSYICRSWQKAYVQGNLITITATFTQVFEA